MDDKNIALLGFISKAADYLKDKIDDQSEEIKEVGEVDLDKIKDELSKRLGSSFDGIKDKKDDLISAGREVFDDFISSNSMIDDFKDIFDIDFKEKNEEKDEHIINHLMEMLNETPEEDTNEYEKIITKATSDLDLKEAQDKKELEIYKDSKQDKEIDSLFSEIVAHENGDDKQETDELFDEEKEDTLTSSQIKTLVENAVNSAVSDALDKFSKKFAPKQEAIDVDEELKNFDEEKEDFVDNEDILEDLSNREKEVEVKKEQFYEPSLDDLLVKDTSGQTSSSDNYKVGDDGVLRFVDETDKDEQEEPKEFEDFLNSSDLPDDQKQAIKNILNSFGDIEVEEEESPFIKTEEVETPTQDDVFVEEEVETPVIEETEEIDEEPIKEHTEETLDLTDQKYFEDVYSKRSLNDLYISNPGADLIKEEPSNEAELEDTYDAPANEEYISQEDVSKDEETDFVDDYINDLMSDLSKESPTEKALEEKQKEIDAKNAVYASIKAVYPYLSDAFIKGVYDLKDTLASEYKENEKIVILHRLRFSDLEGLRRFVEVIMSHDYLVNVDEKQMIVDTFKEHVNADGVILTDIFEVANQAKLLTGEYDGYRILRNEE